MQAVNLHINTKILLQGETIKQTCLGKRFPKEEGWYLIYKEDLGDNQEVISTIKFSPEKTTIIRTGSVRMRQEYIVGEWTEGKYEGPFGMMWMETKTEKIRYESNQFLLSYRLKLNGEDLGRYELTIAMEER